MNFCDFCGKGPFPARSGLNKHIRNSVNCNNAEREKRGRYTTNMWDNAPGSSSANTRLQQVASSLPPILEDDELANMEAFTLDEDVHGPEEDVTNAMGAPPDAPRCHVPYSAILNSIPFPPSNLAPTFPTYSDVSVVSVTPSRAPSHTLRHSDVSTISIIPSSCPTFPAFSIYDLPCSMFRPYMFRATILGFVANNKFITPYHSCG